MAGLPGTTPRVAVGPPKFPRYVESRGSTPTWLWLTPLVSPPPAVPIRLYALDEETTPSTSLAPVVAELYATIVSNNAAAGPLASESPPPGLPDRLSAIVSE